MPEVSEREAVRKARQAYEKTRSGSSHEPRFDVRIGINPISWSNDDLPSLGGETPLEVALSEGKAIGYEGFELGNKFPRESERAAQRAVEARAANCVSGWYSGRLARRGVEEEIAAVGPHLKLLADNGATVMVYGEVADSIQGAPVPLYKRPRFVRDEEWREYADQADRVRAAHARARRAARVSPSHGRVRRDAGRCRSADVAGRERSRSAVRQRAHDLRRRRRDRDARQARRARVSRALQGRAAERASQGIATATGVFCRR